MGDNPPYPASGCFFACVVDEHLLAARGRTAYEMAA